jgi:hypothetical protein
MQQFSEINDYLIHNGYYLSGFYDPFHWGPNKGFLGFCNALYVLPSYPAERFEGDACGSS